ncbi:hypothetical protein SpCBS45565_g01601 [Spizellomyces sp. 'palustris']|nr:hypothetical protein SpCBS45565_g01601 [Spizellomyces sp. 'palustris']
MYRRQLFTFLRRVAPLTVLTIPPMNPSPIPEKPSQKPSHHDPTGGFRNPWPSCQMQTIWSGFGLMKDWRLSNTWKLPPKEERVQVVEMDWEKIKNPSADGSIQATWLGHAAFLIQIEGVNILCDPIFSHRCSPFQFMGPARYTDPPCKIEDLPKIDVVIISHNHYDHLDLTTVKALERDHPHYYVPLGNKSWFAPITSSVTECDWWDEHVLELPGKAKLRIACTPCQHFTGRGLHDRMQTLWSSWAVIGEKGKRFYFAGDTGYRTVHKGADETQVPICPAFKEIGAKYGPFDLACIPIGAYSPRWFMSAVHCSPEDAVCVHQDVKSKRSIGMHWGTFTLTDEDIREPPRRLRAEAERQGLKDGEFGVLQTGETISVGV